MTPHIPILQNMPKTEERFSNQGKLYDDTRYHLANKFSGTGGFSGSMNGNMSQTEYNNQLNR